MDQEKRQDEPDTRARGGWMTGVRARHEFYVAGCKGGAVVVGDRPRAVLATTVHFDGYDDDGTPVVTFQHDLGAHVPSVAQQHGRVGGP